MAKQVFYLMTAVVILTVNRSVSATEPKQMTMTLQPDDEVVLIMAGSGTVTIDWGDGSPSKTHTLLPYDQEVWRYDFRKYAYSRAYSRKSRKSPLTITVNGENITHLECNRLGLKSLDVSKNISLKGLYCHANQLTSLDISNNVALTELNCGNNRLTILDVSKNTELTDLNCRATRLSSLDISNNPKLKILSCEYNQLMNLDVSNNNALMDLDCSHNQLTSLDIGMNTALTFLDCRNNQLTGLDLSNNIELADLLCSDNQLTNLDMENNTKLNYLVCSKNKLTYLGVSHNTSLQGLDCNDNQLSTYALNALFITLHIDTILGGKRICIQNNQGSNTCNLDIALHKGWDLICPAWRARSVREGKDTIIFVVGDIRPLFRGKYPEEEFRKYIAQKTVYSSVAQRNGIQGVVLVEFDINLQGKVENVKVIQSVHPLLDDEALRVVKSSPKWTPGIQRGKKVKVKYQFPFVFSLQ